MMTSQSMVGAHQAPHTLCKDNEALEFVDSDMGLTSITAYKEGRIKWEHTYSTPEARGIWSRKVGQGWVNLVRTPKV